MWQIIVTTCFYLFLGSPNFFDQCMYFSTKLSTLNTVLVIVTRIGAIENSSPRTERAQSYRPNCSEKTESQKAKELPETNPGIEALFIRKGFIRP